MTKARNSTHPTISVVTVCRDSAATIEDTLVSVAQQSWPAVEHIIVDGASTDGTIDVIDRFRAGLAAVVCEPDAGIYDAMNKGLALASGDIVAFLNADDIYAHSEVLATIATTMEAQNLEMLYGNVAIVRPSSPNRVFRVYDSSQFTRARISSGWMPAHPALFVRKSLFTTHGAFRADYRIAGDFEFIARVFSKVDVRHQHLPEVFVRMRTGGASNGGIKAKIEQNREVIRACRENGFTTNWCRMAGRYFWKINELVRTN